MEKEWSEDMGEISGFGGSYERGCRAMVLAGIKWLDEHPDADPLFRGFQGVFGLITEANKDAEELNAAIMNARTTMEDGREVRCGDECTGGMQHAVINHCIAYKKFGWDKYCEELRNRDNSEDK